MMTEPGGAYFDEEEAAALRDYLVNAAASCGPTTSGATTRSTSGREKSARRCPPSDYPIVDLPISHPIFHLLYDMQRVPQIPSINFWVGTGGRTSERGADERRAARARDLSTRTGG